MWSPLVIAFKISYFQNLDIVEVGSFSQIMILLSLLATALTDPAKNIYLTAITITFSNFQCVQDIVIDAYRIESAPQSYQGLGSMYIAGYRLAMLVGGAEFMIASYLVLKLINNLLDDIYISAGALMFVGILTTLLSSEPKVKRNNTSK